MPFSRGSRGSRGLTTCVAAGVAAGLAAASPALGQEAMYTAAATLPSPGSVILREQFHYYRYGSNPENGTVHTDLFQLMNSAQIGLVRNLSLTLDVPVETMAERLEEGRTETTTNLAEVDATFKWRFLQDDTGGIDTLRAALLFGAVLDTEDSRFAFNPHIGAVVTKVIGRHGFNQDLHYIFNTGGSERDNFGGEGPADAITHNSAYVFRVYPDRYTSTSTGAWYATVELNGIYETNGDYELRFAPGFMFEGRRFGFEIMAQLPVYQDVDRRSELDFGVGAGLRFLF